MTASTINTAFTFGNPTEKSKNIHQ